MGELACIDLFCGAGGLTQGLIQEGVDVVAGIDVDAACKHPFEASNSAKFIQGDVAEVPAEQIKDLFGNSRTRVLAGCAPCQPFSTYSQRYETVETPHWGLLYHFARLVKTAEPELVTMENVPSVMKHEVYKDFVSTLKNLGYHVWSNVVDCIEYGLPQRRRRTVLLASRSGPIELISQTHEKAVTVREAIGGMPALDQGGTCGSDTLHTVAKLSDLNLERIRVSKPGGTWRDWPSHLIAECHRRDSGRTYPGVYGRMNWDEPSPTLTTQFYGFGNGRFGHPEQDRAISLREGAIPQGFPASYSFVPDGAPIHFKTLGRLIGNAVPVTLGRIVGKSISAHLDTSSASQTSINMDGLANAEDNLLVA